tara:strand:- start:132 stop:773 length:642 start_codon:yes stop_codon:yes gene_type:complete
MTDNSPQEYNNFKIPGTGCDIYGKPRLDLALELHDRILPFIKKHYFIENGTLLGAWRNNKFIPHDDDFDFGILLDDKVNYRDNIINIFNYIKSNLSEKYKCRLISSYSDKIEVYQPSYDKYLLSEKYNGANYHYITIDLQFYRKINKTQYMAMYHINPFTTIVDIEDILPVKDIMLEDNYFPAPNKTLVFLEKHYGSLDINAKYNKVTGKYHL